ncbi:uncharacterized protein [Argopecten irradians]|uniref:uncharacterized protein n=1 Tax=Argopecten irradians TaxID=31199 RepID=UPI003716869B
MERCMFPSYLVFSLLIVLSQLKQYSTTQLTTMVLHEETKSWADARQVCSQGGGKLLSIQDHEKRADLIYMDSLPSWNHRVMTADLWFGLHTDVGASCDTVQYQWDDGEPLGSWSDWYVGSYTEPNLCTDDLCIRISQSKWKTISCSRQYGFVCEYIGGTCGFETMSNKAFVRGPESGNELDLNNIFIRMQSSNNLASCLEACQTSTIGELECWFVVTNSTNSDVCHLLYTTDKYLADKADNTTITSDAIIRTKRCGNVAVNGETSTTSPPVTTTSCVSLTTTTIPVTTTAAETTTQTETTSTVQQTTTTVVPTTAVTAQTTEGVKCLKYSNQTISYTDSELQEQLQHLRDELTVIKNSTNKHLRTLISVYDGRASATNIGVVGSILLGAIPLLFFIGDLPVLYRHIRGRWEEEDDEEENDECDIVLGDG